jgi:hypothetical protein
MDISPLTDYVLLVVDQQPTVDLVPHILATGLGIGESHKKHIFKFLLNSGGTNPMIEKEIHPYECAT